MCLTCYWIGMAIEQLDLFGFTHDVSDAGDKQKERLRTYDKGHCFQYDIRLRNREEDLFYAGLTEQDVQNLTVSDFTFSNVTTDDGKDGCVEFIKRHEWLGTIAQYTTHYFAARYKGILAGVILMGVPNMFSKVIGDDTENKERLISRGACISWSPKNLASAFLMWCIKWMVDNTEFRVFSAYSDPTAKELGSIYQACNFYYMGQHFGTSTRYINPYTGNIVSDRFFRQRSTYKKIAARLGVRWNPEWNVDSRIMWDKIPKDIADKMRAESKRMQSVAKVVIYPQKHKYIMVLGRDKRETKALRRIFETNNKTYPYPKERGK